MFTAPQRRSGGLPAPLRPIVLKLLRLLLRNITIADLNHPGP